MTTHVNRTIYQPLMNSIVIGRYKSIDFENLGKGYQKPFIVTAEILNQLNGPSMILTRPNKVALKYPNFKKDVDLNAHVRIFDYIVKVNVETFKEYIINAFSYMLRGITLKCYHNYM
jgi:hypothetical protein